MTVSAILCILALSVISSSIGDSSANSHKCRNNRQLQQVVSLNLFPGLMTPLKVHGLYGRLTGYSISNNRTSFALEQKPQDYPSIAVYGEEATNSIICLKSKDTYYELNITLYYCPAGFIHNSTLGVCICPIKVANPQVECDQLHYVTGILVGFCVSRENGKSQLLTARCAFANHLIKPLLPIPQNNTTGETSFCEMFQREGRLCSKCVPGRGISVFSDTYDCISCSHVRAGNFILYLAVELIPTTVFFIVILFFHISITTGAANGFIFFAQMVTTPLEVLFLTFGFKLYVQDNEFFSSTMPELLINPYCIWNLNFFRIFHQDICLHPNLKVIHVLALKYISAIYPLLLLIITYTVIELKAHNIRLVTLLWRLCCFTCVRWRRVWKAKTSVIDAFASCILLSYTKFVLVSLTYLSYSNVVDGHGKVVDKVLSFDTSIHYFGTEHRPFLVIAILVIVTFGAFPPLVLTFYQFQPFQDLLNCLHLRGPGFQRFVEAFQGCYKDGTNGKVDCRFFAGLYFVFRDINFITFAVSTSFPVGFTLIIIATTLFLLLFAVFQPYKKLLYNIVDASILFLFGVVTTLQMYIYNELQQTLQMSKLFLLYYILLCIPLTYMIVYAVHWLYQHWKQRHNQLHTPIARDPDFFRESAIDERSIGTDIPRVGFMRRNNATQSEVSITQLSNDAKDETEGREMEGELARDGIWRRKERWEEERESDEDVREKPCSERDCLLVQRELEPVMQYGTL